MYPRQFFQIFVKPTVARHVMFSAFLRPIDVFFITQFAKLFLHFNSWGTLESTGRSNIKFFTSRCCVNG